MYSISSSQEASLQEAIDSIKAGKYPDEDHIEGCSNEGGVEIQIRYHAAESELRGLLHHVDGSVEKWYSPATPETLEYGIEIDGRSQDGECHSVTEMLEIIKKTSPDVKIDWLVVEHW
jgi:hypothetical protein